MKSNRFYLACLRDTVGSNMAFHRKNGCGYGTDVDAAHVYTREGAQNAWERGRWDNDLPLCADRVDALTEYHVDMQRLPTETVLYPACSRWVYFQARKYNGNDVYWLQRDGLPTCDFCKASEYSVPSENPKIVSVPFAKANAEKRRTINISLLNKRTMVQAAGLITPDHVKRNSRCTPNPKTRWNCPACGKITWQHNPYEYEGCNDIYCPEWDYR